MVDMLGKIQNSIQSMLKLKSGMDTKMKVGQADILVYKPEILAELQKEYDAEKEKFVRMFKSFIVQFGLDDTLKAYTDSELKLMKVTE